MLWFHSIKERVIGKRAHFVNSRAANSNYFVINVYNSTNQKDNQFKLIQNKRKVANSHVWEAGTSESLAFRNSLTNSSTLLRPLYTAITVTLQVHFMSNAFTFEACQTERWMLGKNIQYVSSDGHQLICLQRFESATKPKKTKTCFLFYWEISVLLSHQQVHQVVFQVVVCGCGSQRQSHCDKLLLHFSL